MRSDSSQPLSRPMKSLFLKHQMFLLMGTTCCFFLRTLNISGFVPSCFEWLCGYVPGLWQLFVSARRLSSQTSQKTQAGSWTLMMNICVEPQREFCCCPAWMYSCLFNTLLVTQVAAHMSAVVPHLLCVVYERVVRVDEEDVLGLQVSVSQLVVMEICSGDRRSGRGRESRLVSREPTPSSGRGVLK